MEIICRTSLRAASKQPPFGGLKLRQRRFMSTNPNHTEEVSLSRQKKNPTCIRNKREEHVKSISGRGPISGLHSGLRVQAGRGRAESAGSKQTDRRRAWRLIMRVGSPGAKITQGSERLRAEVREGPAPSPHSHPLLPPPLPWEGQPYIV